MKSPTYLGLSWLPQPIINAHLALVGDVEVIADHLNGMADSFDGGFNERITNKVVKPMVPIVRISLRVMKLVNEVNELVTAVFFEANFPYTFC